jgi:hypothetical protein
MLLPLVGVVGMVAAEPARLEAILVMFRHGLARNRQSPSTTTPAHVCTARPAVNSVQIFDQLPLSGRISFHLASTVDQTI